MVFTPGVVSRARQRSTPLGTSISPRKCWLVFGKPDQFFACAQIVALEPFTASLFFFFFFFLIEDEVLVWESGYVSGMFYFLWVFVWSTIFWKTKNAGFFSRRRLVHTG